MHYFVPVGTNPDLLSWGKDIDGTCIFCEAPWRYFDAETMTCKPVPNYPGTMTTPEYSYVYKYTNKTTPGNITYPDYDIETTKWTGGDNYTVQLENTCPCDLSEFETGTKKLNEILKIAVDSAVEQQARADYEFYDPLLTDPDAVPVVGEPDMNFYEEKDDEGFNFLNSDGSHMEVDINSRTRTDEVNEYWEDFWDEAGVSGDVTM